MTIEYQDDTMTIHLGDCIDVMRGIPDNSIDSIVTDPPYGLGFMGKAWDALPPGKDWADQCLRVLKPGGHVLAFGGTRTWHRLAVAIEDAGFEIRDSIAWLYGSGFPKSLDVSKAIDKTAGHWRGRAGDLETANASMSSGNYARSDKGDPVTAAAAAWAGWGTALKPAFEPIVVGRKPLIGTVAANVQQHGVGAINIDACRVASAEALVRPSVLRSDNDVLGKGLGTQTEPAGRWPANVALDDTQAATLAESRFFYVAKAPTSQRPKVDGVAHPTVKPLDLMRWLARLVTPPNGTILEPFLGSGTTAEAARLEGFNCIGIERDPTYLPLIKQRLGIVDLGLPPWERAA